MAQPSSEDTLRLLEAADRAIEESRSVVQQSRDLRTAWAQNVEMIRFEFRRSNKTEVPK